MTSRQIVWCPVTLLLWATLVFGQSPADPSLLTVERIFSTNEFRQDHRGPWHWLQDRAAFATLKPSVEVKGGQDLVIFDAASGQRETLITARQLTPPKATSPLHVESFSLTKDLDLALLYTNSQRVWRQNTRGDFWVFHRKQGKLFKLGGNAKPSTLMFAKLSPDGKRAGYVRENNLYVEDLETGHIVGLTTDGSSHIINGTFDWVYEEELDCRDGWRWSPDGKSIAYWQLDTQGVKSFTLLNNTDSTYPKLTTFPYPKTGEQNAKCRVGIVHAAGGSTNWLNIPGDSRNHYIARMEWVPNSDDVVIQRLNRLQNENHLLSWNRQSSEAATLHVEKDSAWVDLHEKGLVWLDNGKSYSWISERNGWRHLFIQKQGSERPICVTPGPYDVVQLLHVDEPQKFIYFIASPENPTQRYLYRRELASHGREVRVTPADQPGTHSYQISDDGRYAFHTWSSFESPPQSELISLPDHKTVRPLSDNAKLKEKINQLKKTPVEFFRERADDGIELDGWLIKPPDFDPKKKYPLFFHVYGEPWGQTVTDAWHGSQYLWHLMLAQQGYLVASIDNRGTPAPRGRDWRKSVYRNIGTVASKDQAAVAKALIQRPYVDAARVGIWGWSGGGSMTLNMLFRYPDLYNTGISVASVPDMRLYDTIYQERYMGLPQENAEDYKRGSPITYAGQLKGNLLLIHGTGDDNVHYQGVEKLINTLVAANKPFSMMAYPNRSHGISEGRNTTRHLYELMTNYLHKNLPPGPKP